MYKSLSCIIPVIFLLISVNNHILIVDLLQLTPTNTKILQLTPTNTKITIDVLLQVQILLHALGNNINLRFITELMIIDGPCQADHASHNPSLWLTTRSCLRHKTMKFS